MFIVLNIMAFSFAQVSCARHRVVCHELHRHVCADGFKPSISLRFFGFSGSLMSEDHHGVARGTVTLAYNPFSIPNNLKNLFLLYQYQPAHTVILLVLYITTKDILLSAKRLLFNPYLSFSPLKVSTLC